MIDPGTIVAMTIAAVVGAVFVAIIPRKKEVVYIPMPGSSGRDLYTSLRRAEKTLRPTPPPPEARESDAEYIRRMKLWRAELRGEHHYVPPVDPRSLLPGDWESRPKASSYEEAYAMERRGLIGAPMPPASSYGNAYIKEELDEWPSN